MQRCTFSLKVCLAATILLSLGSCSSNENQYDGNFSQVLAALDWGEGTTTYVIGHKSPDTDAVLFGDHVCLFDERLGLFL